MGWWRSPGNSVNVATNSSRDASGPNVTSLTTPHPL
jgi:hypothetical protein